MSVKNPWNHVPLADYELHMEHQDVGQAQLLNALTGKYLNKIDPQNILFLGVSGGNGLDHVNTAQVNRVCAIDINDAYLEETRRRFGKEIKQLDLVNIDIGSSQASFIRADFVWAALILEYVDIESFFEFITNNTEINSRLIVTIQSNNGVQSVSNTGIDSIKTVGSIFKIIDQDDLQTKAVLSGFECIGSEENFLPNGKSLLTYEFSKSKQI